MLRDMMRETREFPNFIQQEGDQLAELSQRFQQAFMQGLQQAQKEMMQAQQLARKQTRELDDTIMLRDLIVKMSTAQSIDEAVTLLLEVENEDEESE